MGEFETVKVMSTLMIVGFLIHSWLTTVSTSVLPPSRSEVDPHKFRLRTASLQVGATWRPQWEFLAGQEPLCDYGIDCGLSPVIGFDFEVEWNRSQFAL